MDSSSGTTVKTSVSVSPALPHHVANSRHSTSSLTPLMNFTFAGLSGMSATIVVQPFDLIKNRMQLQSSSSSSLHPPHQKPTMTQMIVTTMKTEGGVPGLYNGLSAGLFRQATYTTTRLGVYTSLVDYTKSNDSSFYQKAMIGMIAGGIGAFVGTPAEIALVRMTADGKLPHHQKRHYRHVFHALLRIIREEGLWTLWRGCSPTIMRAMILNAAQLATYSQSKLTLLRTGYFDDTLQCHIVASMFSGLAATIASMPVDIAKTRIQNMTRLKTTTHGDVVNYQGTIDCLTKIIRKEGFFKLWSGFVPYFLRLGPHTILTFIFLEQFQALHKRFQQ